MNLFDNCIRALIALKRFYCSTVLLYTIAYNNNNNKKFMKHDYKIILANNKIQIAWLTSWLVVG